MSAHNSIKYKDVVTFQHFYEEMIYIFEYSADTELEPESILRTSSTMINIIYWTISYNKYIDNSPEY